MDDFEKGQSDARNGEPRIAPDDVFEDVWTAGYDDVVVQVYPHISAKHFKDLLVRAYAMGVADEQKSNGEASMQAGFGDWDPRLKRNHVRALKEAYNAGRFAVYEEMGGYRVGNV